MFIKSVQFSAEPLSIEALASEKSNLRWYHKFLYDNTDAPGVFTLLYIAILSGVIGGTNLSQVIGITGLIFLIAFFVGVMIAGDFLMINLAKMYFNLQNITAENDVNFTQSGAMTCMSTLDFFELHPEHEEYRQKVIEMGRPFVQGEIAWLKNHCDPINSETRNACKQLYTNQNPQKYSG